MSVIRWAMLPPVQLSAEAKVIPLLFNKSNTSRSMLLQFCFITDVFAAKINNFYIFIKKQEILFTI
jgi:hypothetical protein